MADAIDSKSIAARHEGSTPSPGTKKIPLSGYFLFNQNWGNENQSYYGAKTPHHPSP